MKYFVYTIIAIVAAAVLVGFFIVGSPKEERLRRFDEQRIQHLQFLQSEILNYWINKGRLPKSFTELKDDIRGVSIPQDPETGTSYIYEIRGLEKFALCATFSRPSLESQAKPTPPTPEPFFAQTNWEHGTGYTCFERTIDKDFYKPVKIR